MIIVLVGPTASGKSRLAVRLAQRLVRDGRPAEIVNTDSMVVYRGMDIGTAKPRRDELAAVPHHLVDIWDIDRTATVAQFQQLARSVIDECLRRGVVPVLVGGSALYTRAVVDEFTFPGTDPAIRARWAQRAERDGTAAVYEELAARDPAAAAAIEPANTRRIVRALEVIELTGRPFAATLPAPAYALPGVVQIGLTAPREWVDARIARRVEQMWSAGLVDEVRSLAERGLRDAPTASRALGYRQVLTYLDGEIDEAQARECTVVATRKFSRRQLAWWRKDPRISWVEATAAPEEQLAAALRLVTEEPEAAGPACT